MLLPYQEEELPQSEPLGPKMYDLLKISYKKEELAWLGPTHLLSTHLGMYNSSEGQGQKKRSVDPEISS